jgi:hypothetical protein
MEQLTLFYDSQLILKSDIFRSKNNTPFVNSNEFIPAFDVLEKLKVELSTFIKTQIDPVFLDDFVLEIPIETTALNIHQFFGEFVSISEINLFFTILLDVFGHRLSKGNHLLYSSLSDKTHIFELIVLFGTRISNCSNKYDVYRQFSITNKSNKHVITNVA